MKNHTTKYIFIIIIVIIIGMLVWRIGFKDDTGIFSDVSLPKEVTKELGDAQVYEESESDFTFAYPEKLKVSEMPIEGITNGRIILVESGEEEKGFEIIVLPFDESGLLTKERILRDVPNLTIRNEKRILIRDIDALAFESEDENVGPTSEVWFSYGGFLYQARTYLDFGPTMQEILKTWQFK